MLLVTLVCVTFLWLMPSCSAFAALLPKNGPRLLKPTAASSSSLWMMQSDDAAPPPPLIKNTAGRRRGFPLRRITGDGTPYEFPLQPRPFQKEWPTGNKPPFAKYDFARIDYYNDGIFYSIPRLAYHIDEPAVAALTQYYRQSIPAGSDILDICSSWVSHYPTEFKDTMNSISATGMNPIELWFNDQLTNGFQVSDLNQNPTLPFYEDESINVITCACSIDYLIDPIAVLKECHRILRPGGKMIVGFSNRCFGLKAIRIWRMQKDSQEHIELVNGFFQYAGGFHDNRKAFEITAKRPNEGYQDPMFVVEAIKK